MKKETIIDQIEITRDGTINLRFAKRVVDDDGTVLSSGWHRTTLLPEHDIDASIEAVNTNLVRDLGFPAVGASEIGRVKAVAPSVWTNEVRAAHAKKMEESRP